MIGTRTTKTAAQKRLLKNAFIGSASTLALCAMAATAMAQDAAPAPAKADTDVVVVTGIRGSLQRSMNIKKNGTGVVDAISAEDIGKYPDTNLAESIQRIPGVSISRVNGEGSMVTVRGFGPGFNLTTLNGRVMPTAKTQVVSGDDNSDGNQSDGRSFDFSNIASDGISGFEVYKTGNAAMQSGGIGATLNIQTLRPLGKSGSRGSFSVKGLSDEGTHEGKKLTPEISGAWQWTNDANNFGVALFGSHSEEDTANRSVTSNDWKIMKYSDFIASGSGYVTGATQINNAPSDPNQLVSVPNDSRLHYAEDHRERTNIAGTVQWKPAENWTLTLDGLYVDNHSKEARSDQTLWFNKPLDQVTFDGNSTIDTVVAMHETENAPHDFDWEQQQRATEDKLTSIGFNAKWNLSDNLTLNFDAHSSKAESLPDNPNGTSSTQISFGAPVATSHGVDWTSGVPVQTATISDAALGNNDGMLDIGDLGSQPGRTTTVNQSDKIDEARFYGSWHLDNGSHFDFGAGYRRNLMAQANSSTSQTLGDWGLTHVGDIQQYAGDLVHAYCLGCLFDTFDVGNNADIAFRGNAIDIYNALSAHYTAAGAPPTAGSASQNTVQEDVLSAFIQYSTKFDFMGYPADLNAGLRFESTKVDSKTLQAVPTAFLWQGNNDWKVLTGTDLASVAAKGKYDNVLPNLDLAVHFRDDLIARASFSTTIARPSLGNLLSATTYNTPNDPTAMGAIATGSTGNAGLLPLTSQNADLTIEWYYGKNSYIAGGFYHKTVNNFIGVGQTNGALFGLRDPSSGQAGTRSGDAKAAVTSLNATMSDSNLFAMTALIDHYEQSGQAEAAAIQSAKNDFSAHLVGGDLDNNYYVSIENAYDLTGNSDDPLFNFTITQPINNRQAEIYGFEFSGQHFFGDTGFGAAYSLTTVNGNVGFDDGADPSVDQFALVGLSNTYNVTAIYDKYGWSGRLTYNWRDRYLSNVNKGDGYRNPVYVAPFGQLDLAIDYQVTPAVTLSFEGSNLTKEHLRQYGRTEVQVFFDQELDTRYQVGLRYKF